jgi:Tol biopolymer transport system component
MSEWLGAEDPAISPDGRRLAVARDEDIFVVALDGPATRLTFGEGHNRSPSWSPDGRSVLFLSDRAASVTGHRDVYSVRADGSGEAELVHDAEEGVVGARWSPDGEWLLYMTSLEGPTGSDIWGIWRS